jgi:hypothetical protein
MNWHFKFPRTALFPQGVGRHYVKQLTNLQRNQALISKLLVPVVTLS